MTDTTTTATTETLEEFWARIDRIRKTPRTGWDTKISTAAIRHTKG